MDKQSMLKHFTDEDSKMQLARILDLAESCRDRRFSAFIDPVRLASFTDILTKQRDFRLNCLAYGGACGCERKMLGLAPEYIELEYSDFPIESIIVEHNTDFGAKLGHRDYLGALLGLGIERNRIGDIFPSDGSCIIFISKEISRYIIDNMNKAGRVKVSVRPGGTVELTSPGGAEKRITVASLRLDCVLSAAFNISRGRSAELIAGEKAFVNWKLVKNGSNAVDAGDTITLRGFGRAVINEIAGTTKKDRIIVNMRINK